MKRWISFLLAAVMLCSLAACGAGETPSQPAGESVSAAASAPETPDSTAPPAEAGSGTSRVLVAYFSWADNAVLDGEVVDAVTSPSVTPPGNVQQLAGWVQEETGGDLFSIRVTDPYPSDWDACLERANQERGRRCPGRRFGENVEEPKPVRHGVFGGIPTGGYGVPMALALLFWSKTTCPARTCTCSAPTAPAALPTAWN